MTTITLPRAVVEQALEALETLVPTKGPSIYNSARDALRAALAQQAEPTWVCPDSPEHRYAKPGYCEDCGKTLVQQAEPVLQTCNCRWDGEVQVQQCTLHEAHIDAIHEWAERAKVAERKLAQQAEPVSADAAYQRWLADTHAPALRRMDSQGAFAAGWQAAPPQRKPLTEEEIAVLEAKYAPPVHPDFADSDDWVDFARAVERAHGIGDNT